MSLRSSVRWALVAVAAAVVLWVRLLPLTLDDVPDAALLRYRGDDHREHVYLGDVDSYLWLRYARNYLRSGTTCDAIVGGDCRDLHTNAPVGTRTRYARSLHVAAIVGLHRLIHIVQPEYPLPASAFWVPVLVGVVGTVPCFLLGERLAGPLGGFAAAVLVGTNPFFLQRTIGSDNDVWNVVLPLFVAASAAAATGTRRPRRQAASALLAAVFVALQAATWSGWLFTYVVTTFALVANVLMRLLRAAIRVWQRRPGESALLRDGLVPLAIFCPAGAAFAALAGSSQDILAPFHALTSLLAMHGFPRAGDIPTTNWPDVLATVSELVHPDLGVIAAMSGQPLYFFAGWLGLLLLWLPRTRWQARHLFVMVGGNLLYYYLLTGPQLARSLLVALLSLPLGVGVVLAATARRRPARDAGAAFLLTVWFVAALHLSYGGARFVLLLVAPAAVACAVAIGRLHQWLTRTAAELAGGRGAVWGTVLFALLSGTLVPPLERGVAEARGYVPLMNDAWWDTLTHIREAAPADAIVDTWWDYGHWTTYVAERRVSADGASLLTHVPYWLARALMATTEQETLGLLRMLNCGSDATPEPEGRLGAYGKLVAHGIDGGDARSLVSALAGLDRPAARALLAERGLAAADVEDVLASTHCTGPPAYLVVDTRLANMSALRRLATWHFDGPDTARPDQPASLDIVAGWRSCEPEAGGAAWKCPPAENSASGLGVFQYRTQAPEDSRFVGGDAGEDGSATPGVVVLAEAAGSREVRPPTATDADLAVLVDLVERRALVGHRDLIRSTLVDLLYLDGRYAPHFEKFDERVGYGGDRVVTWRLRDAP